MTTTTTRRPRTPGFDVRKLAGQVALPDAPIPAPAEWSEYPLPGEAQWPQKWLVRLWLDHTGYGVLTSERRTYLEERLFAGTRLFFRNITPDELDMLRVTARRHTFPTPVWEAHKIARLGTPLPVVIAMLRAMLHAHPNRAALTATLNEAERVGWPQNFAGDLAHDRDGLTNQEYLPPNQHFGWMLYQNGANLFPATRWGVEHLEACWKTYGDTSFGRGTRYYWWNGEQLILTSHEHLRRALLDVADLHEQLAAKVCPSCFWEHDGRCHLNTPKPGQSAVVLPRIWRWNRDVGYDCTCACHENGTLVPTVIADPEAYPDWLDV